MIFSDIETYIEFIAGYKDINGKQVKWWAEPIIQLASYDINFVSSVAAQTLETQVAMSTKQASLSERLIEKYARQLRNKGIEQPNHKNYRLGVRVIDHSSIVGKIDDLIYFKFPFNEKMIADVKKFAKESQGKVVWNRERRSWDVAITEYNVNWIVCYAMSQNIPISPEVMDLYNLILVAEKTPYVIELCMNDNKEFYISNIPASMKEYIEQYIGFDNIYSLVDNAGILGYTISKEIFDIMRSQHSDNFIKLCASRTIDAVPERGTDCTISDILEWAIIVNRLPIYVYNANFWKPDLSEYKKYFKEEEIQVIGLKDTDKVDSSAKVVYTNKIPAEINDHMPLLITYANLFYGSKKAFLEKAAKVVYYCEKLPRTK